MSLSACSLRSCSSRSRCSRAWRRFSARSLVASSRSVVPAIGLLAVTRGAGAGGEVKTAASGAGSRTRNQHTPAQAPPSPLHAPVPPGPQGDPGGSPAQLLPPTQSSEVLLSGKSLLLATPNPQASLAAHTSDHLPLTGKAGFSALPTFWPLLSLPTCRDLCGLLLLGLGWGG